MSDDAHSCSVYDAERVAEYFDALGKGEWQRFDRTLRDRISLEIHCRFLSEYVRPGDRVLDAGAGPGRFTIELARLGARISVGDISPEQLRLNAVNVAEAGLEGHIEARELLDITDLARLDGRSFDIVVCFGGPLSYVHERGHDALNEFTRVLKPNGYLLLSVMSKLGTHRIWLPEILTEIADRAGLATVDHVFRTGDLGADVQDRGQTCRLYTSRELRGLLENAGYELLAISASNFLTARPDDCALDPNRERTLADWELSACREPGALDGGTHIIAAARSGSG